MDLTHTGYTGVLMSPEPVSAASTSRLTDASHLVGCRSFRGLLNALDSFDICFQIGPMVDQDLRMSQHMPRSMNMCDHIKA